MARTFYSDFAQHCLRFYFRNTSPNFRTEASRKDWEAVDSVLNYFDSKEVDALKSVILPKEPLSDNISWYALNSDWTEDALWKLVATVEKHVATKRGLIA